MMSLLMAILAYAQPGDTNIYWGLDMNIAQYSRYWEDAYETSPTGFRTSQGCIDVKGWYQTYEAKTEAAFNDRFSLRYRFYMVRDYGVEITEHRFEPTMMIIPDVYAHLVIAPYMLKKKDEAGFGFSWRQQNKNWLSCYAIIQGFDHNFSIAFNPEGPENDPFRAHPWKFEIDARGELEWLKARLHAELGTQANQYLNWPDSLWNVWDRSYDRSLAWGRLEFAPVRNLWLGSRFGWRSQRSETTWPGKGEVTYDSLTDFWAEPFMSWHVSPKLELRAEYRFWNVTIEHDTLYEEPVTYTSDYDILSTLISWNPLQWLLIEGGYQHSWRYRYNADTLLPEPWYPDKRYQSRLLFNLEIRARSGMMITIKEGIEMDFFPRATFLRPHNHTYVSMYLPLAILSKQR